MINRLNFIVTMSLCMLCIRPCYLYAQKNNNASILFKLIIHCKDSSIKIQQLDIKTSFEDQVKLYDYVNALPQMLVSKGYPIASIDSSWQLENDLHINLFVGQQYNWITLKLNNNDKNILFENGYAEKNFNNKPFNINMLDEIKQKLLATYENQGYPFAKIYLDSITIINNKISALFKIEKGNIYTIDSIKNYGKLKLNTNFLQRYLNIKNGSIYSREKLNNIDKRMLELPYAQTIASSNLNMLGSGAVVNMYIDNKKSSEASAIFGFLPAANSTGTFQLTGDVNLDLKNVFGAGEGLIFKYQALQPKSPRLNIGFEKPYVFNSPFGLGFLFELFKKDSSFIQLNAQANLQLNLSNFQVGKIIFQIQNTNILQGGIDTNAIKFQKKLPEIIDVKAVNLGLTYEYRKTNYKFNPLRGNEIACTVVTGIKTIEKNSSIVSLVNNGYNYETLYDSIKLKSYQIRIKVAAANYFPLSKTSTFKAAINAGIYSSPNIFRNEIFQIGGYKLLRGFDEESIYATQYAVLTAEYRSLLSLNSYIFGFVDAGATKASYQSVNAQNIFLSAGLGILYETKAGLLNLSFAVGKRNDVPFGIKQGSKIHFGYINYF